MADSIVVEGLSKRYLIQHRQSDGGLRHRIQEAVLGPFQRWRGGAERGASAETTEEFWALRDVSFGVGQGRVVGIIGRNGAGKSTLLKILSRITEPTEGRARIRGRVASLLEVGTGFHPELTGRENILVNSAILGLTRRDVRARFDEIVAFAEVGQFLDTPVKRYSSGMQVRLAFAVAAHLDPDVLIIDEVLAVGDIEFQKKCLGVMRRVAQTEGRTVLFVSHNLAAVRSLCTQALYLRHGRLVGQGDVEEQIGRYTQDAMTQETAPTRHRLSDSLVCESFTIEPGQVVSGAAARFRIEISSRGPATLRELAILVYSGIGTRVAMVDLRSAHGERSFGDGHNLVIRGDLHRLNLVEGDYNLGLYVNCGDVLANFFDLATLTILAGPAAGVSPYAAHHRGYVDLEYDFATEIVDTAVLGHSAAS